MASVRVAAGVAVVGWLLAAIAPGHAEVVKSERISYYDVAGESIEAVMHQLDSLGPPDADGERFHGRTDARIDWDFSFRPVAGGCAIRSVRTKLDLTIIMPRLSAADPELRQHFDDYSARLMMHEIVHADHARETADLIDAALAALPPAATCRELKQRANALGHKIFDEGAQKDVAYDHATDHGRLQGAHFP